MVFGGALVGAVWSRRVCGAVRCPRACLTVGARCSRSVWSPKFPAGRLRDRLFRRIAGVSVGAQRLDYICVLPSKYLHIDSLTDFFCPTAGAGAHVPTHVCVCARVWIRKLVAAEVEFSKFNFFNAPASLIFHSPIHHLLHISLSIKSPPNGDRRTC